MGNGLLKSVRVSYGSWVLILTIFGTLIYFFGVVPLFIRGIFIHGASSVFAWAWQAWNPGANQEHSKVVPLVFLWLIFYHRKEIAAAPKEGSNAGLFFIGYWHSLVCSRRALPSTAASARLAAVSDLRRRLLSLGKTGCANHSFSVRIPDLPDSVWRCRTSYVSAAIRHHVGNRVFEQVGRTSDRRSGNNANRHRRKI